MPSLKEAPTVDFLAVFEGGWTVFKFVSGHPPVGVAHMTDGIGIYMGLTKFFVFLAHVVDDLSTDEKLREAIKSKYKLDEPARKVFEEQVKACIKAEFDDMVKLGMTYIQLLLSARAWFCRT